MVWIALGVAILVESLRMDRLEHLGVNRFTVPGIVPGLLGVALTILGCLLFGRSLMSQSVDADGAAQPTNRQRLVVGSILFAVYALALFGHLPFPLATFVFVAGFILIAEWKDRAAAGERLRGMVFAAVCGAVTAGLVTYVFQYLFLVQLP